MTKITIYSDGAARGNPGPAAISFTIQGLGEPIEHAVTIGSTTNNQAEYRAMAAALEKLSEIAPENSELTFFSDSELMIKQLQGIYRVRDAGLKPLYESIQDKISELKKKNTVTLAAVRRTENKRADQLANLALDGKI